jgi:hypothetical protein
VQKAFETISCLMLIPSTLVRFLRIFMILFKFNVGLAVKLYSLTQF